MKNEKLINDFKLLNEDSKKDFIKIVKNIENGISSEKISIQFGTFLDNTYKKNNIFTKGEYVNILKELLMNCLEKNQDVVNVINPSLKDDFYKDKLYYDIEKVVRGDFREVYDFIINNAIIEVKEDTNPDKSIYKLGIPFKYNEKYYEKDQYFSMTFPRDMTDDPLNMTPVPMEKIEELSKGTQDTFKSPKLSDLKSILEINVLYEPSKYNNAELIMSKIEKVVKVQFAYALIDNINHSDLKMSANLIEQKEDFEKALNEAIKKVGFETNIYNTIFSTKQDIALSKNETNFSLQRSIECFRDDANPNYKKIEENFTKIYSNYVELNYNYLFKENYRDYAKYNSLVETEKEKKEIEKIFDIENENDYDSVE